jgi:ADP-ribosylglycohydrolase
VPLLLDPAYLERVYAGVLGKIIGVYLGRPFEGWTYEKVRERLGEVDYYVHDRLGLPLIVADDDITGTFTFLRALRDHGDSAGVTPEQIGRSWLNYLIEGRTILWWGGLGNSTEHTAYLRMLEGVMPPRSGSAELNTRAVAEQIGAQIFVDGWAMVAPGDPVLAADLARRAGSVSHDGEALHAAAAWAAMEAEAFVERDTQHLIDTALDAVPRDSVIARLIEDVRRWHDDEPDWRATRERIEAEYGYERYGGNVHVVPNHALMQLGLLYAQGSFSRGLTIVTTSGWDTDCNGGNLGALLGLQLGLDGIDTGADWRGPVADRLFLPSTDGSRGISDALRVAVDIADTARALRGEPSMAPKDGARFSFALPGSVQGFRLEDSRGAVAARLGNAPSAAFGERALVLDVERLGRGHDLVLTTPTFIPPEARQKVGSYELLAAPTLHPGQIVTARLARGEGAGEVAAAIVIDVYDERDELRRIDGPAIPIGESATDLRWTVPDTGGQPVAAVGLRFSTPDAARGRIEIDRIDWSGTPSTRWVRPEGGTMWARAWVDAVDHWQTTWAEDSFRLIQDRGTGIVSTGGPWDGLRLEADVTVHAARSAGIAVRVAGIHRYRALVVDETGTARLVQREHADERVLAEAPVPWRLDEPIALALEADGDVLRGWIDGMLVGEVATSGGPAAGGIGLLVTEGRAATDEVRVRPL